jgi:calcineurin-like phosphoesterase family protein
MATLWFTSDTHFGHGNIIRYCNRPFKSVDEMNEVLIRNWNSVVQPGDEVWHLGDVAFGSMEKAHACIRRLNGTKHLVWGNHDEGYEWEKLFASTQHYKELHVGKQELVLSHYAMRSWHHNMRGTVMLYGHSHGTLPSYGKSMDVGVDAARMFWNMRPISFGEVMSEMNRHEVETSEGFVCRDCKNFPCTCK